MTSGLLPFTMTQPESGDRLFVLERLNRDHRRIRAYIELVEQRLTEPRALAHPAVKTETLIQRLLGAPDEYHHHLEKRSYKLACSRLGECMARLFPFLKHHEEIRQQRDRLVTSEIVAWRRYDESADARDAILGFCALRRSKMELEEKRLFPLLEKTLNGNDWRALRGEIEAYDDILSAFHRSRMALGVNGLQERLPSTGPA